MAEQLHLWDQQHPTELQFERTRGMEYFNLYQGELVYYPHFFSLAESDRYLEQLTSEIDWRHEPIKVYGREILQPRLTAWYGDAGKSYTYSGINMQPQPWTAALLTIKQEIETIAGVIFNSVLLTLYRDGQDSMGWHSDDEPELGTNPIIASVSFGATRKFQLRHKSRKDLDKVVINLSHGSFLLMAGITQHHWQHQIPKTTKVTNPRINLTFRIVHA
uniref:2OG-Fe(II) oxygenase n=1 Tax=Cyanothece sp. (strain PCC 7425 / ATCC 29141) TaxID=395961 RepID=B8HW11_CYAP4